MAAVPVKFLNAAVSTVAFHGTHWLPCLSPKPGKTEAHPLSSLQTRWTWQTSSPEHLCPREGNWGEATSSSLHCVISGPVWDKDEQKSRGISCLWECGCFLLGQLLGCCGPLHSSRAPEQLFELAGGGRMPRATGSATALTSLPNLQVTFK